MSRRFRKTLLALVVLLALAMVTSLVLFRGQPPQRPPLPIPNGYDDFYKAGEITTLDVGNFAALDLVGLRTLVLTNAESLRLLRTGLTRQCAFPMDSALTNINLSRLQDMRRLLYLLTAEGRLRELDNEPVQAVKSYMDAIRFSDEWSRGGLLITRLLGVALEKLGYQALVTVVQKLKAEDSRSIIGELEKIDSGRVTWAEILKNEKYYIRYQMRNRFNPILLMLSWWQIKQALQKAETQHNMIMALERLLSGELALRLYRSERGQPPSRLDDIVPGYLSRVPEDPFSGKPMVYSPQGTNWLFYSVGPDGVDNGGNPAGKGWPVKDDLLFDSTW